MTARFELGERWLNLKRSRDRAFEYREPQSIRGASGDHHGLLFFGLARVVNEQHATQGRYGFFEEFEALRS